jgi:hypothetical protein
MSNRNVNFMRQTWGADHLDKKMLREINNDLLTPKKHDFQIQNELHEKIRNDEDYDDWEYGTEPLYEGKKS